MIYVNKEELVNQNKLKVKKLKMLPSLRDFNLIKVIGTGGYSSVVMGKIFINLIVRQKINGELFAMKIINKKDILD